MSERPDCRCAVPQPDGTGKCSACGRFACEYAGRGRTRCPSGICDCFIEEFPDSPRALHPEAFVVLGTSADPPQLDDGPDGPPGPLFPYPDDPKDPRS